MNTSIDPLSLLSGTEALSNAREGWTLDHTEGFTEDRVFRTRVHFDRPFSATPVVHIGIAGFDISNHDSARIKATVARITQSGFDIVLSTWLNSRLWKVDVSWMAIGR